MKVVFIRHGESEANVNNLINQDVHIHVGLTGKGRRQAARAAKKLDGIDFDVIYVSPFVRTRETAEIINQKWNLDMIIDSDLHEVAVGHEGETGGESGFYSFKDFQYFSEKGHENWKDLKKRMKKFISKLKKEKYEKVLVVTHEWNVLFVNAILKKMKNNEMFKQDKLENCGFREFEI